MLSAIAKYGVKISLGFVMCLALATAVVRADDSLGPGRVGPLRLGMSEADIYKAYPKDLTKKSDVEHSEDGGSPVHQVDVWLVKEANRSSLRIYLERADGGITGIEVRDSRFKMANGLGLGSSLGELRRAGKPIYFAAGEGGLSAVVEDWKMAFRIDLSGTGLDEKTLKQIYAHNSPWPHEKEDDPLIPDRTTISSIWVH